MNDRQCPSHCPPQRSSRQRSDVHSTLYPGATLSHYSLIGIWQQDRRPMLQLQPASTLRRYSPFTILHENGPRLDRPPCVGCQSTLPPTDLSRCVDAPHVLPPLSSPAMRADTPGQARSVLKRKQSAGRSSAGPHAAAASINDTTQPLRGGTRQA